jgi:hypothetical protein
VVVSTHLGKIGHTSTVQQAFSFGIKETKKHTLSPGLAFPMFAVRVVDWPLCNGEERLKSCGLSVNVLPGRGVRRICDISLPELFVAVNV